MSLVWILWSITTVLTLIGLILFITDAVPKNWRDLGLGLAAFAGSGWTGLSIALLTMEV